jgi:hypothetical protein
MGKKKKNKKTPPPAEIKQPEIPVSADIPEIPADLPKESAEPRVEEKASEANSETPIVTSTKEIPVNIDLRRAKLAASIRPSSGVEEKLNHRIKPQSRIRRMLPDILRVVLAFSVIAFGSVIWLKPPLFKASFPITTFRYKGKAAQTARLYRPIAMQERYYVELPQKIEGRYQWFAIDRRREEVALCEEPSRRFFGKKAIRRGDPLGLDLEFRNIDGSEWLIHF